jgi:hypothetical protein
MRPRALAAAFALALGLCLGRAAAIAGEAATAEDLEYGFSVGGGYGAVDERFETAGGDLRMRYAAPGLDFDFECGIGGGWRLAVGFEMFFAPSFLEVGGEGVRAEGGPSLALDAMILGLGYRLPLSRDLSLCADAGIHAAAFYFAPPADGGLEANCGFLGIGIVPSLRYALSDAVVLTLSAPIGLDLAGFGDEARSPTTPYPLTPSGGGLSLGAYLSIGCRLFYAAPSGGSGDALEAL